MRDKPLSFDWAAKDQNWCDALALPPAPTKRHLIAREAILLDAVTEAHGYDRDISYSRRKAFYTGKRRYFGTAFTYDTVRWSVDSLTRDEWLSTWIAPPGRSVGRQSTLRAAPELAVTVALPPLEFVAGETVRMKDSAGNLVDYRDTERTRRMRHEIAAINEAIDGVEITLEVDDAGVNGSLLELPTAEGKAGPAVVNMAHTNLYRVFNGGWGQGGRFYGGWWQNVPKAHRASIRMDDAPTIEPDYSRLHPNLLYARVGERLPIDPYDIPGWPVPIVKRAFLIVINARNYQSAVGAIAATIREYPDDDVDAFLEVEPTANIYQDKAACIDAGNLIRGIKDRHRPIERYFHSGIGLELQNLDSRMAEMVMQSMRKKAVATLPIHDSFMVPINAKSMLLEGMNEAMEWAKKQPENR